MPAYYAVIPATIRYDSRISANAKLLYGEITALCNEKGFCWATNGYFAKLYSVTARSIKTWISSLEEMGYITVNVRYKNDGKTVDSRCISINDTCDLASPVVKKTSPPREENFTTPGEENFPYNNKIYNNTFNNKKESKTAQQKGSFDFLIDEYIKTVDQSKSEIIKNLLREWLKVRKAKRAAMTDMAIKINLDKLNEMAEKSELGVEKYLEDVIARGWQAFYPIIQYGQSKKKSKVYNYDASIDEIFGIKDEDDG